MIYKNNLHVVKSKQTITITMKHIFFLQKYFALINGT